jgi:hypothetical protein
MRIAPRNQLRNGGRRDGNAYVEFALVFLLLLTLIVGLFEFTWVLFLRATFHHAVREGVRHAITGNPGQGTSGTLGLDDSIKQVIKRNSFGLLNDAALDAHVAVEFFDASCNGQASGCGTGGGAPATSAAEAGSIVRVSINCYSLTPITTLIRKDPTTGGASPFTLTVSSSDKMEPFPGAPPDRGTMAAPTACP